MNAYSSMKSFITYVQRTYVLYANVILTSCLASYCINP